MGYVTEDDMKRFLGKSLSSVNSNKINGTLAEIDLRDYLKSLGYGDRISPGGWIFRSVRHGGTGRFASSHVALFPETVRAWKDYRSPVETPVIPSSLQAVAISLRQIGVESYYCVPYFPYSQDPEKVEWALFEMASPSPAGKDLSSAMKNFPSRTSRYNFLRYSSDPSVIPQSSLPVEFTKELLRVSVSGLYMAEVSDIDGVFWGNNIAYPLEIKEKTMAADSKIGGYFGIDVGPFAKLAFYAARRGNMHSLFIVRQIRDTAKRELVTWRFIEFEEIALYASWIFQGGGRNMQGGSSAVIKIPADRFGTLNGGALQSL